MAQRYSLHNIGDLRGKKVFFDANVLIYLFWPTGGRNIENSYSSVFSKLLKQENKLYIDFLVVSEIINRTHRIEYTKYLQNNDLVAQQCPYKQFRDYHEGKSALEDIYLIVQTYILNYFEVIGIVYTKENIEDYLHIENLDFIDKAILTLCKENDCILCTNDKDYRNVDIDILTTNRSILNE